MSECTDRILCADASDGFNLSVTGEHQFQFLDVTSSPELDDMAPQDVAGVTHYYPTLPQPPQQVYVFIDQSGGIYPTSASVGAGSVLTTSGYVAPMAPLIAPQPMLPAAMIPAASPATSILPPTLLRPGLLQQPPAPSVIMPGGLMTAPPAAVLPSPVATSIVPAHAAMLPLAHGVADMPLPTVSELPLNASGTLPGPPIHAGANMVGDQLLSSVPVDMCNANSPPLNDVYTACGNMNNSAAEQTVSSCSDASCQESTTTELASPADGDVVKHGNGLSAYPECERGEDELLSGTVDGCPVTVNGEFSIDTSHEPGSLSETSSVTSPYGTLADMALNDSSSSREVSVTKDVLMASSAADSFPSPPTSAFPSPPTSAKTKVPSWASLLKDTTSATNAIVISVNDGHAITTQQKSDVKSVAKEPVVQQSSGSRVTYDEKLKFEMSGLYILPVIWT